MCVANLLTLEDAGVGAVGKGDHDPGRDLRHAALAHLPQRRRLSDLLNQGGSVATEPGWFSSYGASGKGDHDPGRDLRDATPAHLPPTTILPHTIELCKQQVNDFLGESTF